MAIEESLGNLTNPGASTVANDTIIDGIFASEAWDSSGEKLEVKGCDISDAENGLATAVYEHKKPSDAGASANDHVGRVIYIHKIYTADDCENDRQREYWDKVQLPMIYGVVRLFDGSGHEGAKAVAAIVRDQVAHGEKLLVRYSVEGSTLFKNPQNNHLERTIMRRIAITLRPCNRSCDSGLLFDPQAPKETTDEGKQQLKQIKKDENVDPRFQHLGGDNELECNPLCDIQFLGKATTAGGSVLGVEHLASSMEEHEHHRRLVSKAKKTLGDWNKQGKFKDFLKMQMPEADKEFIDRFGDMVDDVKVKPSAVEKTEPVVMFERLAVDLRKAAAELEAPHQQPEGAIRFGGKLVQPGTAVLPSGQKYFLVGEDPTHFIGAKMPLKDGKFGASDLVKLPRAKHGSHFQVLACPVTQPEL